MEWNQTTLQFLSQCFLHTLSPLPEPRRSAEKSLAEAADAPNYGLAVLRLVAEPSIDEQTRHAAAVNFKNHLRSRWLPSADSGISPIVDSEKEQIKTLIVSLMLSSSPRIQSQLSEALAVIGKHDFPKSWPALLPELIANLRNAVNAGDYASINGILGTASSIFKKFRYQYRTDDLFTDLKYCLDSFAAPLTEIFQKTSSLIDSSASSGGSAAILKPLFESQRLCCRIFYSLNFQDLPEFFEDHMKEWMGEFKKYLASNYPALESTKAGLTLVDDLRAAVCENINLYIEKNEEEFKDFLNDFALVVWTLLRDVSKSPSRDQLATTAIKFLTTVSTSVHHALFAGDNVIKEICQSIVVPNVCLRAEDEEVFDMNYIEFIRRDMEGSDVDTRRRIACELLKGLATNYKTQVTEVVSVEIQKLLSSFSANPATNWKDKDCAIYLVVSLSTKKAGGASVSTDLIDVQSFFTNIILPELQSRDVNSFPMLKAGSLKFLTLFRSHMPKPFAMQLFPELVRFLKAESNVVHSYAASCIEKLLLVKEEGGQGNRYAAGDISPFLLQLMTNLFDALKFPESEENQYLMKCIMRVLGVADISAEVAGPCIGGLTSILNDVCKNPKNPIFNHYLFESVAVLVRRACERDISLISAFETSLFPSLQMILVNDITEFLPYAFQLLAQLVELNRPPLAPSYMHIFLLLLSPESWKRSGNVPALVRLLQAFLQKASHEVTQENRLSQVLGIFEKLVASPSTDEQGFYILNTIIENLDYSVVAPYMKGVWGALFTRLQNKKTVKFQKSLVIFMSLFLVKHGQAYLVETMNTVQPNILTAILEHFWIPNLKLIMGTIEVKLAAVAATRLICETPALLDPSAAKLWGKMLDSIVTLVSRPEQERVLDEPEMPEISENIGYTAAFVNLHNAGKKEEDPLKDIKDPKQFVVASVSRLSSASPGRYPQIIGENLEQANQAALIQLCNAYNCGIA
ncbi:PREDICTED: exportin-2-like [Camelina sativa]|uniref:Exportin-2-like n=2 Tax=Camelina sativa TaxID=90675 RepID=A0ABM0ZNP7_CAMSA|nr:PREDICTED: exportin-2-like [Camelina sativa]